VEFSSGTAAGGFSTAAAELVEGAGQEGPAAEEGFQQRRELLLQLLYLGAQRAEVVGHGWASGSVGAVSVDYYQY
jgi:hypothetical protein